MRRALVVGFLGLLVATGIWFLAFREDTVTEPVPTAPEQTPVELPEAGGVVPGGVARYGSLFEPVGLNPLLERSDGLDLVGELIYAGLLDYDPFTQEPVPDLAVEVPSFDNGGLVSQPDGTLRVRYLIDERAVWEDGAPITGEDVVFTAALIADETLPIHPALVEAHADIVPGSVAATVDGAELVLSGPSLAFLDLFPVLVPAHAVAPETFATSFSSEPWLSAGPFQFQRWAPGSELVLVRNDQYWRTSGDLSLPLLDELEIRFARDSDELVSGLRSGTIDAAGITVSDTDLAGTDLGEETLEVQLARGPGWVQIAVNTSVPVEQRRTLLSVLDRGALVAAAAGELVPVAQSMVLGSWSAAAGTWAQPAGAGSRPGPLEAVSANRPEQELLLGEATGQWQEAGLRVEPLLVRSGQLVRDVLLPGDWSIASWVWENTPGPPGAIRDLETWFGSGRLHDSIYGGDDTQPGAFDALTEVFDTLATTADLDEARELIGEIELAIAQMGVLIPVYQLPNPGVVATDRLAGYLHAGSRPDTWNAELWWVP